MPALSERDREIISVMAEERANPYLIRERTQWGKGEVETTLEKLEHWGFVRKVTRGLYEITDEGRAALERDS